MASQGQPQAQMPPHLLNLCQILQGCLSQQSEIMKAAEAQLNLAERQPGQSVNLLQVRGPQASLHIAPFASVCQRDSPHSTRRI